jgi:hypothetical protein
MFSTLSLTLSTPGRKVRPGGLIPMHILMGEFSDPKHLKTRPQKEIDFCWTATTSFRLPWKSVWTLQLQGSPEQQYWVMAFPVSTAIEAALEPAVERSTDVKPELFDHNMWGDGGGNSSFLLSSISAAIEVSSLSPRFTSFRARLLIKRAALLLDDFQLARHAKDDIDAALRLDRHAKLPPGLFLKLKLAEKTKEVAPSPPPTPVESSATEPTGETGKKKKKKKKKKKQKPEGEPATSSSS